MSTHQIGYIRVSTHLQNTVRQLHGIELDQTYTDKTSGSSTDRPQLDAMLVHIRPGDTIHVHSIDRLARNLLDLMNLIETIIKKKATVRFHKEALQFSGDDNPMQRMMLQLMGAVAEFERHMINERAAEGRAIAMANGVKFGPTPLIDDKTAQEIKFKRDGGETISRLARDHDCTRQTIYRAIERVKRLSASSIKQ